VQGALGLKHAEAAEAVAAEAAAAAEAAEAEAAAEEAAAAAPTAEASTCGDGCGGGAGPKPTAAFTAEGAPQD
jgi:hypothetical protein